MYAGIPHSYCLPNALRSRFRVILTLPISDGYDDVANVSPPPLRGFQLVVKTELQGQTNSSGPGQVRQLGHSLLQQIRLR